MPHKYKSVIDEKFKVGSDVWVISLLNSDSSTVGKFTGHSVLLIEGVVDDEPFIRQCDIKAAPLEEEAQSTIGAPFRNVKGVITDVRIYESYWENKEKYKQLSARSWHRSPAEVKKMLDSIKEDKEQTEAAKRGEAEYIKYQYAGSFRFQFFSSDQDGDEISPNNCPTWCYEKLEIAGINIKKLPFDNIKAMPQKHVKPGAEFAEDTIGGKCLIL